MSPCVWLESFTGFVDPTLEALHYFKVLSSNPIISHKCTNWLPTLNKSRKVLYPFSHSSPTGSLILISDFSMPSTLIVHSELVCLSYYRQSLNRLRHYSIKHKFTVLFFFAKIYFEGSFYDFVSGVFLGFIMCSFII